MRWTAVVLITLMLAAPAAGQSRVGIVLVHGKQSAPQHMTNVADALLSAGYAVERPEMCWSASRIYDMAYLDCLRDIDAAVERLRSAGASGVVVVGFSLGGNGALAYGARREGLLGTIALGPAPAIEFVSRRAEISDSLAKARQLAAQGHGETRAAFKDSNGGVLFDVTTTPNAYLSFWSAESPGVMPDNAAKQKAPLLVVSGQLDQSQRSVGYVFARTPQHPLNWHVTLHATHRETPMAARDIMLGWLKLLVSAGKN